MGGTIILSLGQSGSQWGSHAQHIAPRPADQYPDISLAPNNPMSVALTERHHKSQDNYLLGKTLGTEICQIHNNYLPTPEAQTL